MKRYFLIFVILILISGTSFIYLQHSRAPKGPMCQKGSMVNGDICTPLDKADPAMLEPFLGAGCQKSQGTDTENFLLCDKASFKQQFNCMNYGEVYNVFGYPMMSCSVAINDSRVKRGEVNDSTYFSCSGGLMRTCSGVIMYRDSQFILIKNEHELINMLGSIKTPEQAQWLVRMVKGVSLSIEKDYEKAPQIATRIENGMFIVTGYYKAVFGCFSPKKDYPVYKYTYSVTPNGIITEKSKDVAYKYKGTGICVD